MDKPEVGGMGEAWLFTWARQQPGVEANKVQHDVGGWDLLLTWFPAGRGQQLPVDRQPGPLHCFIQVKSSNSLRRRPAISLRNAMRFTTTPLPAFYLILDFQDQRQPQRVFLRHHWDEDMEKTLRRVRELDAARIDSWQKRTRSLVWTEDDGILPTSDALFRTLERHIGPNLSKYASKKAHLLDQLGYDEHGAILELTGAVPYEYRDKDLSELFADLYLGLIPELPTTRATVWDNRFGIRAREPLKELGEGILTAPEPKLVTVRLRSGARQIDVPGKLFAFGGFTEEVDLSQSKLRLEIGFLEIHYDFGQRTGSLRSILPTLTEWRQGREFAYWAEALMFLEEAAARSARDTAVKLGIDDLEPMNLVLEDLQVPPERLDLAKTARSFWRIMRRAEVDNRSTTRLGLLIQQQQKIALLDHLLTGDLPDPRFVFTYSVDSGQQLWESEDFVVPVLHWVESRDVLVVFPFRHFGRGASQPSEEGDQLVVTVERTEVLEPIVVSTAEWPKLERWDALLSQLGHALPQHYQVVEWWQWQPLE